MLPLCTPVCEVFVVITGIPDLDEADSEEEEELPPSTPKGLEDALRKQQDAIELGTPSTTLSTA